MKSGAATPTPLAGPLGGYLPKTDSYMPSAPPGGGSGGSTPNAPDRPFKEMGKSSLSLYGPAGYYAQFDPSQDEKDQSLVQGEAFKGVPVLEQAAQAVGGIANIPGYVISLPERFKASRVWEENAGTAQRRYWEALVANNAVSQEVAEAQFRRQLFEEQHAGDKGIFKGLFAPTGDYSLGGQVITGMTNAFALPQRPWIRTTGGNVGTFLGSLARGDFRSPAEQRLDSFREATDEQLNYGAGDTGHPELIDIRNRLNRGEISADEAFDELIVAGFGVSNPTDLLPSIFNELGSDPTNLLGLGAGTLAVAGSRAALSGGRALAKDLGEEGLKTFARDLAGKGIVASEHNLISHALKDPAMLEVAEKAVRANTNRLTQFMLLDAPAITRVGNAVNEALGPLSLFGRDSLGKATAEQFSRKLGSGVINGYGASNYRAVVANATKDLGDDVAEIMQDGFDRAAMQIGLQVGNEQNIRHIRVTQSLDGVGNDPTAAAMGSASRLGGDIARRAQDRVERVRFRVVPTSRGKEGLEAALRTVRERAAQQVLSMARGKVDRAGAEAFVAKLSEDQLSLLDFMHYGKVTEDFIVARNEATALGVMDEAARTTFIGPRQLTRPVLDNLRKAMNKGQVSVVRGIIEKYDDLYRIYDLELSSDELMRQLRETYDQLVDHAPQVLTDIKGLPEPLQAFLRKYEAMGYHIGLSPDADTLARPLYDKSGRIVGVNPWVDLVDGKTARASIGRLQVIQRGLFNNISGSSVIREAEHRFIRLGAERFGMPEQALRGVFSGIMREASNRRVTVRGLHPHEMYQIALDTRLPKALRSRMTERDLAELVLEAHEGSLSKVGVTQKFTGKMKTNAIVYGGTNALGILAEKLYPALRFTLNPFFQLQELIETPFFMILRGRVPMSDFRRIWTAGGRAEISNEIDKTLWVMGLVERKGSFYAQDMMEMSMLTLHGNRAINAQVRRNGILEKFGRAVPNVARMKEWGVARSFQYEQARALRSALKQASPDSWENFARWLAYRSGQKNDLDAVTNFIYDTVAKADPDSAYAQFGHQALKPAHLGVQGKISTALIRGLIYGEKEGKAVKWKTLLDEIAKGERSATEVSDALTRIGADPIYIQRAVDLVTFPRPDDFYKAFLRLGRTQEEVDAMRASAQALARLRGVSEHEQIASMYAAAPRSLSHLGEVKSRKLFQAIADSFIARGMNVPAADDPAIARLADAGAVHLPDLPLPDEGARVKDLTPAQKKRRDFEVATQKMLEDPTGTVGRPPSLTGGVSPEQGRAIQQAYDAGDIELGQRLQREATEAPGAIPGFGVPPAEGSFPARYVTATRNGATIHKLGPVSGDEWWDMLHSNMDQDTLVEKADWYVDMRRGFLALADGDEEEAARLIVLFGISQLNTSPVDGMRFIHRALAAHRRGEPLPIDQKFSGLNSAAVKQLLEETQLTEAGLGQKLIDFVDSLLGRKTRTAGPVGPDPMNPWGPVAGDIWAKRDLGFLDPKMTTHLRRVYDAKAVEFDEVKGFTITMKNGDVVNIPKEKITGGVPSDTEYAYIVQFYNDRAREANARRFLDRDNWSAAEMQALGWFRAKFAMGDRTGSPLDAFHKNVHSVHWEAAPGPNSRYADVFPGTAKDDAGLPEEPLKGITKDVAAFVQQEAQQLVGVQVIARFDGVGAWQGGLNPNAAFEVLGTPEDAQAFARVIAYLSQQEGVPVSRLVPNGKAKASEGRFNAIDWSPADGSIATYDQAEKVLRRLAAEHPAVRDGGGSIVRYDDGSYGVRAIWFDGDSLKDFKAAFPDETLGDVDGFVGERTVIESSYHENNYDQFPNGEGHLNWLKENGYASVADKLASSGRDRAALYYERAYRKHYAHGLDQWRNERALDDEWAERAGPLLDDLDVAYGRSSALDATAGPDVLRRAADAAARGDALFQRYPRGTLGAIAFDGDTNRARIYLNAKTTNADTLLHEESHRFAEQGLDPSGRAAILDAYNADVARRAARRKPVAGQPGVPARTTTWTEEVHEWFAKQYIEWVRTGESPAKHLDPIFGFYAKYLTSTTAKAKMSPQVRTILNEVTSRKPTRVSAANDDEVALMNIMIGEADRSARNARDLIHFRTNRSWVERSLNHPYFGMYPLSYMWGKVLPELVEFLVFRPFGVPAPLVAYNTVGDIYRGVMLQQENDPELREYLTDNEPAMRALAMLVPGVPWDLPVNSPLWLRRMAEAVATQNKRVLDGEYNPDGTPASIDLAKIDAPRIIGEVAGYALNPVRGVENLADSATSVVAGLGIAGSALTGQPLPNSEPDPRNLQPAALTTETPQGTTTPAPPSPALVGGPLAQPLQQAEQDLTNALTP